MRRIDELLSEYGESHQHATNKTIHWICVPLIFFSIVGLIASIHSEGLQRAIRPGNPYAKWAGIVTALHLSYYVTLYISLSIGMLLFCVYCLFTANFIMQLNIVPLWLVIITIFVIAWIGQFYGHKIDCKKPSFFKDIQFLLI